VKASNNNERLERRWPDLLTSLLVHGASALFATVVVILLAEHAKGGWIWITLLIAAFFAGYIVVLFCLTLVSAYISHRFGSRKEQNATRTNSYTAAHK